MPNRTDTAKLQPLLTSKLQVAGRIFRSERKPEMSLLERVHGARLKIFSFSITFLLLSIGQQAEGNELAFATPSRSFHIRQVISSHRGVLTSQPNSDDEYIFKFLVSQQIYSLGEYVQWLKANIFYKSDIVSEWASPQETLTRRFGDCEDYTILNISVLQVLGFQPRFLASIQKNGGHAICVFEKDGLFFWFNNNQLIASSAKNFSEFKDYITQYLGSSSLLELDLAQKHWRILYQRS